MYNFKRITERNIQLGLQLPARPKKENRDLCLFCNISSHPEGKTNIYFVCSKCVQLLLKYNQDELKKGLIVNLVCLAIAAGIAYYFGFNPLG